MEQSLTTSSVTTALTVGTESCVIEFVLWGQKQRKGTSSPNAFSPTFITQCFKPWREALKLLPAQLTPMDSTS